MKKRQYKVLKDFRYEDYVELEEGSIISTTASKAEKYLDSDCLAPLTDSRKGAEKVAAIAINEKEIEIKTEG